MEVPEKKIKFFMLLLTMYLTALRGKLLVSTNVNKLLHKLGYYLLDSQYDIKINLQNKVCVIIYIKRVEKLALCTFYIGLLYGKHGSTERFFWLKKASCLHLIPSLNCLIIKLDADTKQRSIAYIA